MLHHEDQFRAPLPQNYQKIAGVQHHEDKFGAPSKKLLEDGRSAAS